MIIHQYLNKFGTLDTPFYFYDLGLLKETLSKLRALSQEMGYHVHYAVKANSNDRILKVIREYGFGADCVSGNEVVKSLETGFPRESVVFAGVGKSDKEIVTALKEDIFGFNSESFQELEVINELASAHDRKANISLRINPNVDAKTHKNITTGLEENKFGINQWELDQAVEYVRSSSHLNLIGLHFHIGSQVTDLSRYMELTTRVNEINQWFHEKGISLEHINVGGGLGIDYHDPLNHLIPDFETYFGIFRDSLRLFPGQQVHFELGRAIVGQCGVLITKVLYEKVGKKRHFLILDAGMTELMRPALYQAHHHIVNLVSHAKEQVVYDIVGPICETTDAFARDLSLPKSKRGDYMALYSAGAYGEVLKNRYNLREEIEAVYSEDL